MSHHIYQTEAFVIDSRAVGEANKIIYLLTKDLGLVATSAQGVRLLKSKLRYSTQDYSYSKVSLVRGREVWRLTSAALIEKIYPWENSLGPVFARGLLLVKRLVTGEEKNQALFDVLKSTIDFLHGSDANSVSADYFECILILRILHTLGYVSSVGNLAEFLKDNSWSTDVVENVKEKRPSIIKQINQALKESQL